MTGITLDDVTRLDPRIGRILGNVREARGARDWDIEYARTKRELSRRVGHFAASGTREELCTTEAYDVVMREVARRLNGTRMRRVPA